MQKNNKLEEAEEVKTIMNSLIPEDVKEVANISVVFETDKARRWSAKVKKADKFLKFYTGIDFIMVVKKEAFEKLSEEQKKALVAHELEHIEIYEDKEGKPQARLRDHDVECFTSIVEKYGTWTSQLKELGRAIKKVAK